MKKLVGYLSLVILWGTCAHAADMLLKSTPTNGSVTDKPPSTFVLEFSEDVTLHDLYLKRDDEKRPKSVGNLPSKSATAFTVPAPSLSAGAYSLEWTVYTWNSRVMKGRVRFTVAPEQGGSAPAH